MMITNSIGLWNDKEAGEGMKLNWDCFYSVLKTVSELCDIKVENQPCTIQFNPIPISVIMNKLPEYSREDVFYAAFNLYQAKFIFATMEKETSSIRNFEITGISYKGIEQLVFQELSAKDDQQENSAQ